MKKILLYMLGTFLVVCFFSACKKGFNDQQSVSPDPQQPDLTSKVTMSLTGLVTNENGTAVSNALVIAGTKSTRTDNYGYFRITDALLSKTAPFVSVLKEGYFDGYRTFTYKESGGNFARIKLVPKMNVGSFNAASGGTVTTSDGGLVSLPANGVVVASTNTPYSGVVHVAAHLYKQNDANEFTITSPGDNRGISIEGYLNSLKSYGMMAVELTGDAGELLQIAPGKQASITTPIPSSLLSIAPSSIPLWSFDVIKGLWKQEGSTTRNGNSYIGNVSHFSFWDGAVGMPLVNLTVQIVNSALQPLGNVVVYVYKTDDSTTTMAYTDNQGIASGAVPANTALVLKVYKSCNNAGVILSQNFNTNTADIDLGTIVADLGDQAMISGSVVNCNNQPVANGYVLLTLSPNSSFFNTVILPVTNGSFNSPVAVCSNVNGTYVAIDNDTQQQGAAQITAITPGQNNLGILSACGTSSSAVFNYRIDNGAWKNLSVPTDIMYALCYNGNINDVITISCNSAVNTTNNPDMQFTINAPDISGNRTITLFQSTSFLPPSNQASAISPVTVTITELGQQINDFMAGSFSGTVQDPVDNSIHTIDCNFRVRRIQ